MTAPGTVLFYAAGGGLGHLARTFAIAAALPTPPLPARILCTSDLAHLARDAAPAPLDRPDDAVLASRTRYWRYVTDYLDEHDVRMIVLDAFPWGIVGEWAVLGRMIPRVLVARSLRWDAYRSRAAADADAPVPRAALALEPLAPDYRRMLAEWGELTDLPDPILPANTAHHDQSRPAPLQERMLAIHSGNAAEQEELLQFARHSCLDAGRPDMPVDTLFPDRHTFPATGLMRTYRFIAAGCGYNMAAAARRALPGQEFFLHPFERRFDDQRARLRNLRTGLWRGGAENGAHAAACWVAHHALMALK
ncbi:MAG TPA: hypothetical protein PKM65_12935 [Spirochaetota bacterium]|nr:hypothetical protein [Spirochaetota bacterium]HNT10969.1 hypothetical protein [Spirochaetota bacterium]